ncbi:MAG: tRNA 2-thiouridine(34) synthase MnmA [Oscillospiraceae bacterium]|nr:tRNA 2-thiouridine(34) synthase MnmA [Oscillospiraceae bacterium]
MKSSNEKNASAVDLKRALIAMSGGVDSSVAAYLSKQMGLDCIGVTMKLFGNEEVGAGCDKSCCSLGDAEDARSVAHKLDMLYYVFNFAADFKRDVIERFVRAYQNGETPNPCIDCNRYLKFEKLLMRARSMDIDYIATGHYAGIDYDAQKGRYILKKAVDLDKDQSYFLYAMTQEQLKHTLFPLGKLSKSQVRDIAKEQGFINAGKRESQDICFVRGGNYADFIRSHIGGEIPKGRFKDVSGNDLGEHKGIIYYTVGQRKGLGLSMPAPAYVCEIRAEDNTVVIGAKEDLYSKTLFARDINLITTDKLDMPLKVCARVRYRQREQPATVWQLDEDTLRIEFDSPQRAVTKGQAVVLYDGDIVIGGGTIK